VRDLPAKTTNPAAPNEVDVSRPSDANTTTGLLLGLGAVALLVGGIGVANTMVISVLEERRAETGLRRSLGATRQHIRNQFLTESLLLSLLGRRGSCWDRPSQPYTRQCKSGPPSSPPGSWQGPSRQL
jgi:putative ABC transport system permease protein